MQDLPGLCAFRVCMYVCMYVMYVMYVCMDVCMYACIQAMIVPSIPCNGALLCAMYVGFYARARILLQSISLPFPCLQVPRRFAMSYHAS